MVKIKLQLSPYLISVLRCKALITKTSVSKIANKALSFSFPVLLEEIQAQEDYRLEVEPLE